MRDACYGEDSLEVSTAIAVGVVVAQPDYPYSKATQKEVIDIPIYGVTAKNRRFIAPQSVKMATMPDMDDDEMVEREMWATAGDYLCVVTGTGRSIKQASERAYKVVDDLHISDMIYRDDIGEKIEDELPTLQEHGYATEFEYE
jgi:phosphoribosylamine-glycine ligase